MATPKLRFKEFNGDWKNLSYKDVLTINYGKDHKKLSEGNIPVYGTGGVMRHVDQYLYAGESILIGRKGTIDKPKYVNEEFWTVDTLFYTKIKSNALPKFIFQHSMQVNWLGLNEATGVPSLNTNSINNVAIGLPTLHEQTKIANFLSAVDEKINQLNQKVELLMQYKQGMMQKLFSQKIRFKADDGSEFGEWEELSLNSFVNSYKGGASLKPSDFVDKLGFEVIPKKSIGANGKLLLSLKNPTYCSNTFYENNLKSVVNKDYLITVLRDLVPSGPNIGYIVKFNSLKEYILAQGVYAFKTNLKLNDEYLIHYSNTIEYRLIMQSIMVGSTQVHIRKQDFFDILIPYCCIEEQTKIANFLSSIDQKIDLTEQQLQQAKQWKKGLLQQMFV